jgi:uncharacterized protein (UPF0332 family)
MKLTPEEQLTKLRLQQAEESLAEAESLYNSGFFRGAINRSYYAMFYSVLALTVLKQASTSKHGSLISFFDREFVKTGIFPKELSKSLHFAFQKRQENDYGDVFTVNSDESSQVLADAKVFIESIIEYFVSLT